MKEKSKLQEEQSFFPVPVTLRGERIMACMFKLTTLFCSLFLSLCSLAQEKEKTPEFSNTDEIHLVITQSERVFEQYKQSVTMEEELPTSKKTPSGVEKDRAVYVMAAKLTAAMKVHPEGFRGVGGLLLLSVLDDASRNAALCSGTAYNDSMEVLMSKSNIDSAQNWMHVGLSCVDISSYLYTVSESVEALLIRDLKAQEILNQRAGEALANCTSALKKCAASARK